MKPADESGRDIGSAGSAGRPHTDLPGGEGSEFPRHTSTLRATSAVMPAWVVMI